MVHESDDLSFGCYERPYLCLTDSTGQLKKTLTARGAYRSPMPPDSFPATARIEAQLLDSESNSDLQLEAEYLGEQAGQCLDQENPGYPNFDWFSGDVEPQKPLWVSLTEWKQILPHLDAGSYRTHVVESFMYQKNLSYFMNLSDAFLENGDAREFMFINGEQIARSSGDRTAVVYAYLYHPGESAVAKITIRYKNHIATFNASLSGPPIPLGSPTCGNAPYKVRMFIKFLNEPDVENSLADSEGAFFRVTVPGHPKPVYSQSLGVSSCIYYSCPFEATELERCSGQYPIYSLIPEKGLIMEEDIWTLYKKTDASSDRTVVAVSESTTVKNPAKVDLFPPAGSGGIIEYKLTANACPHTDNPPEEENSSEPPSDGEGSTPFTPPSGDGSSHPEDDPNNSDSNYAGNDGPVEEGDETTTGDNEEYPCVPGGSQDEQDLNNLLCVSGVVGENSDLINGTYQKSTRTSTATDIIYNRTRTRHIWEKTDICGEPTTGFNAEKITIKLQDYNKCLCVDEDFKEPVWTICFDEASGPRPVGRKYTDKEIELFSRIALGATVEDDPSETIRKWGSDITLNICEGATYNDYTVINEVVEDINSLFSKLDIGKTITVTTAGQTVGTLPPAEAIHLFICDEDRFKLVVNKGHQNGGYFSSDGLAARGLMPANRKFFVDTKQYANSGNLSRAQIYINEEKTGNERNFIIRKAIAKSLGLLKSPQLDDVDLAYYYGLTTDTVLFKSTARYSDEGFFPSEFFCLDKKIISMLYESVISSGDTAADISSKLSALTNENCGGGYSSVLFYHPYVSSTISDSPPTRNDSAFTWQSVSIPHQNSNVQISSGTCCQSDDCDESTPPIPEEPPTTPEEPSSGSDSASPPTSGEGDSLSPGEGENTIGSVPCNIDVDAIKNVKAFCVEEFETLSDGGSINPDYYLHVKSKILGCYISEGGFILSGGVKVVQWKNSLSRFSPDTAFIQYVYETPPGYTGDSGITYKVGHLYLFFDSVSNPATYVMMGFGDDVDVSTLPIIMKPNSAHRVRGKIKITPVKGCSSDAEGAINHTAALSICITGNGILDGCYKPYLVTKVGSSTTSVILARDSDIEEGDFIGPGPLKDGAVTIALDNDNSCVATLVSRSVTDFTLAEVPLSLGFPAKFNYLNVIYNLNFIDSCNDDGSCGNVRILSGCKSNVSCGAVDDICGDETSGPANFYPPPPGGEDTNEACGSNKKATDGIYGNTGDEDVVKFTQECEQRGGTVLHIPGQPAPRTPLDCSTTITASGFPNDSAFKINGTYQYLAPENYPTTKPDGTPIDFGGEGGRNIWAKDDGRFFIRLWTETIGGSPVTQWSIWTWFPYNPGPPGFPIIMYKKSDPNSHFPNCPEETVKGGWEDLSGVHDLTNFELTASSSPIPRYNFCCEPESSGEDNYPGDPGGDAPSCHEGEGVPTGGIYGPDTDPKVGKFIEDCHADGGSTHIVPATNSKPEYRYCCKKYGSAPVDGGGNDGKIATATHLCIDVTESLTVGISGPAKYFRGCYVSGYEAPDNCAPSAEDVQNVPAWCVTKKDDSNTAFCLEPRTASGAIVTPKIWERPGETNITVEEVTILPGAEDPVVLQHNFGEASGPVTLSIIANSNNASSWVGTYDGVQWVFQALNECGGLQVGGVACGSTKKLSSPCDDKTNNPNGKGSPWNKRDGGSYRVAHEGGTWYLYGPEFSYDQNAIQGPEVDPAKGTSRLYATSTDGDITDGITNWVPSNQILNHHNINERVQASSFEFLRLRVVGPKCCDELVGDNAGDIPPSEATGPVDDEGNSIGAGEGTGGANSYGSIRGCIDEKFEVCIEEACGTNELGAGIPPEPGLIDNELPHFEKVCGGAEFIEGTSIQRINKDTINNEGVFRYTFFKAGGHDADDINSLKSCVEKLNELISPQPKGPRLVYINQNTASDSVYKKSNVFVIVSSRADLEGTHLPALAASQGGNLNMSGYAFPPANHAGYASRFYNTAGDIGGGWIWINSEVVTDDAGTVQGGLPAGSPHRRSFIWEEATQLIGYGNDVEKYCDGRDATDSMFHQFKYVNPNPAQGFSPEDIYAIKTLYKDYVTTGKPIHLVAKDVREQENREETNCNPGAQAQESIPNNNFSPCACYEFEAKGCDSIGQELQPHHQTGVNGGVAPAGNGNKDLVSFGSAQTPRGYHVYPDGNGHFSDFTNVSAKFDGTSYFTSKDGQQENLCWNMVESHGGTWGRGVGPPIARQIDGYPHKHGYGVAVSFWFKKTGAPSGKMEGVVTHCYGMGQNGEYPSSTIGGWGVFYKNGKLIFVVSSQGYSGVEYISVPEKQGDTQYGSIDANDEWTHYFFWHNANDEEANVSAGGGGRFGNGIIAVKYRPANADALSQLRIVPVDGNHDNAFSATAGAEFAIGVNKFQGATNPLNNAEIDLVKVWDNVAEFDKMDSIAEADWNEGKGRSCAKGLAACVGQNFDAGDRDANTVDTSTQPNVVEGHYPVFESEEAAKTRSPVHRADKVEISGKTYYMPQGLVLGETIFMGDYGSDSGVGGGGGASSTSTTTSSTTTTTSSDDGGTTTTSY